MGDFLLIDPPIPVDFTNVMDESEQHPLDVNLGFRTEREMVQPFLHTEIRKDRLHDRQAPGVDLSARRCIDPGFHLLDQVGRGTVHLDG